MIDRQFRLARHWSNRELRKLAPHFDGNVANVSAGDDIDKEGSTYREYFSNASTYHTTNWFPGARRGFQDREGEYLLDLTDTVPDELTHRFDAVLCHTVFEHVFEVTRAFQNMCLLTRDVAIVIVPFAQVQHEANSYFDFWRFTPRCLAHLFQRNDMEVVYESWNNEPNASVYILSVASRTPERWQGRFGEQTPMALPADWIGQPGNSGFGDSTRNLFKTFREFLPYRRDKRMGRSAA